MVMPILVHIKYKKVPSYNNMEDDDNVELIFYYFHMAKYGWILENGIFKAFCNGNINIIKVAAYTLVL